MPVHTNYNKSKLKVTDNKKRLELHCQLRTKYTQTQAREQKRTYRLHRAQKVLRR